MYTDEEHRETLANARATLARTATRKSELVYKTTHTPTPVADAVHETLA